MEDKLLANNMPKTSTILTWSLITLSIISCCSRPDYNIIIGFLILFFRGLNSSEKRKLITRVQIQLLLLSLIFDIFWIIRYNSLWTHGEETSELWRSLSSVHNMAFYLGVIEFLIKIPLCLFFYKYFSDNQGVIKELMNFQYKPNKE